MSDQLSLAWSPLLPLSLLAGLGGACLLMLALSFARKASGTAWRALLAALLMLLLANPAAVIEQRESLEDVVLVIVDRSPSQEIDPRPAQSDAALAALLDSLAGLPDLEVRTIETSGQELGRGVEGTRLFSAIDRALSEIARDRIAGLFLITDGQVHDAPASLSQLAIDAPLHTLLTGLPEEGDRRLSLSQVPSFGIVGKTITFKLRVDDLPGERSGVSAMVRMLRDGQALELLQVPIGVDYPVEFEVDHRGPSVLEIEVEPAARELSLINNRAVAVVNGVRDRLRVLLVSGEPHPGERAWRNILKSDPSVDLVHFTILRPPEKQDFTPINELSLIAFPTRELFEVKLDEFDLVIFDRYQRRGVLPTLYLGNVATYVENGGALLEAVGPSFASPTSLYRTPLGRVLPAVPTGATSEGGFTPRVTELGHRHPVTAALPGSPAPDSDDLPDWGRWFRQIDTDAERGAVVMTGEDDKPLLILDRFDKGRIAQLTSDHIWLWSRGFEGGGPQAELVRRVAHWLMKEPDLEEENLSVTITGDRLEVRRRSLDETLPEIEVVGADGTPQSLALEPDGPGRGRAVMAIEDSGLYRVSDGQRVALAATGPLNLTEFEDLRASGERLAELLDESDGKLVALHAEELPELRKVKPGRSRHGRSWLGIVGYERYFVTGVERTPLLPALLALLIGLAMLLAAWRREGR
jgi:hypothetical protein